MSSDCMGSSSPCEDCHKKLLDLGIKRIIYSGDNNQLFSVKPKDYIPYGPSLGRKYISCDFNIVKNY